MKTLKLSLSFTLIVLLMGCQNESTTIIPNPISNNNIIANSPLANLLSRVSQNPTSQDNVLDNSSCFSVQLPVTVIVNFQQILVNSENDYQTVQVAIDAFSNDDDIVNFIFPITIQYQNSTIEVVNSSNQLDDVLDNCGDDDGFDEIDCINIVYPIIINLYNANNQIAQTVTITSNSQLYNFIESIDNNELIAIHYPISIINSSGQNVSINNNSQLENSIDDSIDDCEDSSGGGNISFSQVLTNGTWKVSYFFDNQEETSNYANYRFTYNTNGTILVVNGSNTSLGTWSTYVDSGEDKIEFTFDSSALQDFVEDWKIVEYTNNTIRLKHVSGGNGGTDYLYFEKI